MSENTISNSENNTVSWYGRTVSLLMPLFVNRRHKLLSRSPLSCVVSVVGVDGVVGAASPSEEERAALAGVVPSHCTLPGTQLSPVAPRSCH